MKGTLVPALGGLSVNLTAMTRYHSVWFNGLEMLTHIRNGPGLDISDSSWCLDKYMWSFERFMTEHLFDFSQHLSWTIWFSLISFFVYFTSAYISLQTGCGVPTLLSGYFIGIPQFQLDGTCLRDYLDEWGRFTRQISLHKLLKCLTW